MHELNEGDNVPACYSGLWVVACVLTFVWGLAIGLHWNNDEPAVLPDAHADIIRNYHKADSILRDSITDLRASLDTMPAETIYIHRAHAVTLHLSNDSLWAILLQRPN